MKTSAVSAGTVHVNMLPFRCVGFFFFQYDPEPIDVDFHVVVAVSVSVMSL